MGTTFQISFVIFVLLMVAFLPLTDISADLFSPWKIEKLVGQKAPGFTVKDLSGQSVSLSSFQGKTILLNFWATWCPYCREEREYLNALYREYRDKDLVIIAVSTDRSSQKVKAYAKRIPMDFVVLHDETKEAAGLYGVYSLPTLRNWTDRRSKVLIERLLKD
jgi:peroxiredoxin